MKRNQTSRVAIIIFTIVMIFMVGLINLLLHTKTVIAKINEELVYLIELDNSIEEAGITILLNRLVEMDGIIDVDYISRSEALEMMSSEITGLSVEGVENNPFREHLSFHIEASKTDPEIKLTINEIKKLDFVNNVYYQEVLVRQIRKLMYGFSFSLLILTIILLFVNYSLVYNFMKLLLYTNHKEIKTMQLVGARESFIKKPYTKSIMGITYKSIVFLFLVLILGYIIFIIYTPWVFIYFEWYFLVLSVLIVCVLSIIGSYASSRVILNKLLNESAV